MAYFFYKIINIEFLLEELHTLKLEDKHKHHLAAILDSCFYHVILDEILTHLNEEDKKLFLKKVNEDPGSHGLLEFLNSRVEGIEEKIKKAADELISRMYKDIKVAKKL